LSVSCHSLNKGDLAHTKTHMAQNIQPIKNI